MCGGLFPTFTSGGASIDAANTPGCEAYACQHVLARRELLDDHYGNAARQLVAETQRAEHKRATDLHASARKHCSLTRHRASTSMYSLTFRVRVATPAQYGRNGTASLQITSHTQQARRLYRWCVRAVCTGPGGLPLGSATHFRNVAIAMHPVHRLQIRPIVHN